MQKWLYCHVDDVKWLHWLAVGVQAGKISYPPEPFFTVPVVINTGLRIGSTVCTMGTGGGNPHNFWVWGPLSGPQTFGSSELQTSAQHITRVTIVAYHRVFVEAYHKRHMPRKILDEY